MFAAAIGIETRSEAEVRALVPGEDGARRVAEVLGRNAAGIGFSVELGIVGVVEPLEAVRRVLGATPPAGRGAGRLAGPGGRLYRERN
jgi:hypothetical protein